MDIKARIEDLETRIAKKRLALLRASNRRTEKSVIFCARLRDEIEALSRELLAAMGELKNLELQRK